MKKKRDFAEKIKRFFKLLYLKFFRINDTPQKVALGAGLGVFSGIMPGSGPIAAIALAFLLRVNRAAALLGSLITNTWLSFVIFILAIKTGSFISGTDWQEVHKQCLAVFTRFNWQEFLAISFLKVILPVITGYLVIGVCLGIITYLITLFILLNIKNKRLKFRQ